MVSFANSTALFRCGPPSFGGVRIGDPVSFTAPFAVSAGGRDGTAYVPPPEGTSLQNVMDGGTRGGTSSVSAPDTAGVFRPDVDESSPGHATGVDKEGYRAALDRCATLLGQFMASDYDDDVSSRAEEALSREIEAMRAQGVGDTVFRASVYRLCAANALTRFIDHYGANREFAHIIDSLIDLPTGATPSSALKAEMSKYIATYEYVEGPTPGYGPLMHANELLKVLGIKRKENGVLITNDLLQRFFEGVDTHHPDISLCAEIAENFGHALSMTFNRGLFVRNLFSAITGGAIWQKELLLFRDSLPGALRILTAFRDRLIGADISESVSVGDFFRDMQGLIDVRFGYWNSLPDWRLSERIVAQHPGKILLQHADKNGLALAVWEVVKNSLREGKLTRAQLQDLVDRREAYLHLSSSQGTIDGKPVIILRVGDGGRHIDIARLIERIQSDPRLYRQYLVGWSFRDVTIGQLVDLLSQRHISVPLADDQESHSGIGLHSAREEILRHNGELFMANVEGGVETLIVIPREGKNSDWRVTEVPVSGFMLNDFSRGAAVRAEHMIMFSALAAILAARHSPHRRRVP